MMDRATLERADGAKADGFGTDGFCLRLVLVGWARSTSSFNLGVAVSAGWMLLKTSSFFQARTLSLDFSLLFWLKLLRIFVESVRFKGSNAQIPRFLIPISMLTSLVGRESRGESLRRSKMLFSSSGFVPAVGRPIRKATCFNWAALSWKDGFREAMMLVLPNQDFTSWARDCVLAGNKLMRRKRASVAN